MENHLAIPRLRRARDTPAGNGITFGERIAAGVQRGQVALDAENTDGDEDRQADPAPRSEPPGRNERHPDRQHRRRCPAPGSRLLRQPRSESDAAAEGERHRENGTAGHVPFSLTAFPAR
jgi:hypothetical protein